MIVKHSYITARARRGGAATPKLAAKAAMGTALAHVRYLQHRPGPDREEGGRKFLNEYGDEVEGTEVRNELRQLGSRGVIIHKLVLAPDVNPADAVELTNEVLHRLEEEKGLDLRWRSVVHQNTAHHHVHVIVYGKDKNGREVRFNKNDYQRMKEFGDEWLERNHPIEREQKRFERQKERDIDSQKKAMVREQQRIAAKAYNDRHYIQLWKREALSQMYGGVERDYEGNLAKEFDIEKFAKQVLERQNEDLRFNKRCDTQGDPVGGRWVSPTQEALTGNRAFSMFQAAAGICNELVRSIELTDKRDPLELARNELEERRKQLQGAWSEFKDTPYRTRVEQLLDETDKALRLVEEFEMERRRESNRGKRDQDLDYLGG